jgi:RNA polymerase sigma-70 factor (ECF subfamily)
LERVDWVHQALDQLSPIARIIVVMFYFEDKSYQQIAQELDVPMGTVMSRLSRSKDMLREALLKTAKPVSLVKAK